MKIKLHFILILILFFVFSKSKLHAQALLSVSSDSIKCETEPIDSATFFNWPYFGNNEYLISRKYLEKAFLSTKGRFKIQSWIWSEIKDGITSTLPNGIARTIRQDRNGNIWIAAFDGVFRYDGKSFTNITSKVSDARFFSVLEDRKGNLWFGSIGSGVYYYDGISFQNFTTRERLPNNEIVCIYEDKIGNIWFGANGGVSRYDGKSFRNYMMNGDSISEDRTGKIFPNFTRPPNEVNSIIEDKTGKFWFATRGNTFVYDGKTFTTVTHNYKPFRNVRWIIEDKKGNIWLGGADGLWRYEGNTFTNITQNFVGYIYEDRKGNIWTSVLTI